MLITSLAIHIVTLYSTGNHRDIYLFFFNCILGLNILLMSVAPI